MTKSKKEIDTMIALKQVVSNFNDM